MGVTLDDLGDTRTAPARLPGDFQRHPTTGAPYVSHPTETTAKGLPRRVMYGRPSGFGGALDNPYNLVKWKERQLLIGIAEVGFDGMTFDPTDRDAIDGLAARCHEAAGSSLAADRGTHVHLLCERIDKDTTPIDVDDPLIAVGVELGIPAQLQLRVITQWWDFRESLGVTALAIEATVVHDGWQLAGTLDRLDQATRRINTSLGWITKGKAFIGDIKTGSLTTDNNGSPRYWVKYPVQLAAYADAVPYDTDTDQRGVWPVPPHRKIALIYHYDLARALDGELVDWQAIPVDLAAGRVGGAAALEAKQFRPVFGDPIAIAPSPVTEVSPCSTSTSTAPTTPTPEPIPTTAPPTITSETDRMDGSVSTTTGTPKTDGLVPTTDGPDHPLILATQMLEWPLPTRTRLAAIWPFEYPTPGSVRRGESEWTAEQLTAIRVLCAQVDAPWDTAPTTGVNRWTTTASPGTNTPAATTPSTPPTTPTSTDDSVTTPTIAAPSSTTSSPNDQSTTVEPDPVADLSGGPLDPTALDALLAACTADDTRMIINAWLAESRVANCYWNPRIVGTVRSFEQARAARALATMHDGSDTADEFVRLILACALLTDAAMFASTPIGVAIGALTIEEACVVVATVEAIDAERLTLRYTDDGTPLLLVGGVIRPEDAPTIREGWCHL